MTRSHCTASRLGIGISSIIDIVIIVGDSAAIVRLIGLPLDRAVTGPRVYRGFKNLESRPGPAARWGASAPDGTVRCDRSTYLYVRVASHRTVRAEEMADSPRRAALADETLCAMWAATAAAEAEVPVSQSVSHY